MLFPISLISDFQPPGLGENKRTLFKLPCLLKGKGERVAEDEMVGWHHLLNGHDFEQTLGDSEGQGSPACCSSQGHQESDTTKGLNKKNQWRMGLVGRKLILETGDEVRQNGN